jgi:thioredoxin
MVRELNDEGVEEKVLESDGLVAVAFMAYGSVPCKHFRPELDATADAVEGKIGFYKIDVDENPSITEDLGVEAVPTLLVFRDGEEVARYEGPYSREALGDRLNTLLAGKRSTE